MTREELKEKISMREILSRYGISVNKKGQCRCPFHSDQHASMKVYKNDFYCFACGAGGDIFNFVMKMEGISFKDAFKMLGGEMDSSAGKAWKEKKEKRDLALAQIDSQLREIRDKYYACNNHIKVIDDKLKVTIPTSDLWVELVNYKSTLECRLANLDAEDERLLAERKTIEETY